MIAIIDYGAGNLFSVKNALKYLKIECELTSDAKALSAADGLILPGVGAFPDAMRMLKESGLIPVIKEQALTVKKPLLGICLGMQALFEKGFEFEETEGLGLIPGTVEPLKSFWTKNCAVDQFKVPHMGWNELVVSQPCALSEGLVEGDCVYFVHSFAVRTEDRYLNAWCDYGGRITAMVSRENVYGTQFHPEKSGETGLSILRNFGRLVTK